MSSESIATAAKNLLTAYQTGDVRKAQEINLDVLRVTRAMMSIGGAPGAKAGMKLLGLESGEPRLPIVPATPHQVSVLADAMRAVGVLA